MFFNSFVLMCLIVNTRGHINETSDKELFPQPPNFVLQSDNRQCAEQSELYLQQLNNLTLWAYDIFDATEKSLSGFLRGNVYHFGDWEECIAAPAPFKTKYCLAQIYLKAPAPKQLRNPYDLHFDPFESVLNKLQKTPDVSQVRRDLAYIGICIPSTCSSADVQTTLDNYLKNQKTYLSQENVSYSAVVSPELCQTADDFNNLDGIDTAFCLLVALLVFLVFSGTTYDQMQAEKVKKLQKIEKYSLFEKLALSFSVKRNFRDLQKGDTKSPLSILHGVKVVSICMIIMDHRFGTFTSGPVRNFDYIEEQYKIGAAFAIFHGDLFVDSFFVLSGILVAYILLEQYEKRMVNPLVVFLVRYVRLTPVYAFAIFFYASVFENTGSGPLWKMIVGPEAEDCRKNWWISLLYLSNYINDENMCMVHSWYLPCDFHYLIVATFIIIILRTHKKTGLSILAFLLVLSIVAPFVITVIYKRPPMLLFYPDFLVAPKAHQDFRLTYTKSHTRASPYIIGLFIGYLYYRLRESSWKMNKGPSHILTIISAVFLIGGMGSGAIFYNAERPYNALEAGFYASFHRIVWALGTVGLLITASHGHLTCLRAVLAWRPLVSLGKLVYSAYIVHMQFVIRAVAGTKYPRYLSLTDMVPLIFGDIVVSFLTAFLLYLAIEMPLRNILKELFASQVSKPIAESNVAQKIMNRSNDTNERIINRDGVESRL